MANDPSRPRLNGFRFSKWKNLNPFVHYAGCLPSRWDDSREDLATIRDHIRQHGRIGNLSLINELHCLESDAYDDYPKQGLLHLGEDKRTKPPIPKAPIKASWVEGDEEKKPRRITHMPAINFTLDPVGVAREVTALKQIAHKNSTPKGRESNARPGGLASHRQTIITRHQKARLRQEAEEARRREKLAYEERRAKAYFEGQLAKQDWFEQTNPTNWTETTWKNKILQESQRGWFAPADFCCKLNLHPSFTDLIEVMCRRLFNEGKLSKRY